MNRWFNGEYIHAETGEEETYATDKLTDVLRMVRLMKDGDELTIHVQERDSL